MNRVHYSSAKGDWGTPQDFFDRLNDEFHFGLDVCAHRENKRCRRFIPPPWHHPCGPLTADEMSRADALMLDWYGLCWMNPPYGREIVEWVKMACLESHRPSTTVVGLVPARTDTAWWHDWVMRATEIRLVRGRLKFEGADNSAPFPSAVVVWRGWTYAGGPVFSVMGARA